MRIKRQQVSQKGSFVKSPFLYDKPLSIQSFRILHQTITVTNLSRNVTVWDSRYSRCTFSNCKSRNLVWRQVTATFTSEKEHSSGEFFFILFRQELTLIFCQIGRAYPSRTLCPFFQNVNCTVARIMGNHNILWR